MLSATDSAVVFFSRDGNTRCGAEVLSRKLGAKLVELQEERPGKALHALLRMRTPLKGNPWAEIASARRVYLLCPIWAGSTVPAMNAFADGADFTGKVVQIITFQQNPGRQGHREQRHLAGIVKRNHGSLGDCYSLAGGKMGKFAGEAFIRAQIDVVRLPEEVPGGMPEEAPGGMPEESPGGAPEEAPGGAPEEAPGGAPVEVPGGMPEESPGGAPEEAPGGAPGEVPGGAPVEVPGGAPVEVPGGMPEEAPGRVPEEVPGGAPVEVPGGMPEEAPGGVPEEMPGGAPVEVPGGAPEEMPKVEPTGEAL